MAFEIDMYFFQYVKKIKVSRDDEVRAKMPGRFGANLGVLLLACSADPRLYHTQITTTAHPQPMGHGNGTHRSAPCIHLDRLVTVH